MVRSTYTHKQTHTKHFYILFVTSKNKEAKKINKTGVSLLCYHKNQL